MKTSSLQTNDADIDRLSEELIRWQEEKKLSHIVDPLPFPDEQTKIVTAFEDVNQKNSDHQREVVALLNLFLTLLHELMTDSVRSH